MIFDQHVHSNFSFDSNEDLENYINVCNENDIITTEHLDLENPIINYKDSLIDYLKYIEQIKDLNKKYSNKFFSGIENGYTQKSEKRIEDFLKNKNFNLKYSLLNSYFKLFIAFLEKYPYTYELFFN